MSYVFLTGATGNAGRPVLNELHRRGIPVVALLRTRITLEGCRSVVGDLANIERQAQEIANAKAVLHLASPRSNTRDVVIREDIVGTSKLLDCWQNGNFVYMSSQTVYGIPTQTLSEPCRIDPTCWYDLGKVCGEYLLQMAELQSPRGAPVSLRTAVLFGAGPRRHDRQFLSMVYQRCLQSNTFIFDSDEGLETYGSSFIGPEDLGRAVVDSLAVKERGSYNIAGSYCTWRALIEAINKQSGTRSGFTVRRGAQAGPGEFRLPQSRSLLDVSKFAAQTGFVPRQDLDEVVSEFIKWDRVLSAKNI